ncbi:hypothetical protein GUJ93_ZPchr0010g7370 [Zizania palustris]|uniref:Signal recognition particle SRP54 subunit M-domain domain-containing protein n=1 Tax=Zizania palustris TaxID=103762 RepID=A0A8J6BN95_ZIZPA|nr:hypothetical protein GUJ93_ZPchr0010g7370 [Zizania palustris]
MLHTCAAPLPPHCDPALYLHRGSPHGTCRLSAALPHRLVEVTALMTSTPYDADGTARRDAAVAFLVRQEDAVELQKKILSAKFNFNDFLKQSQNVAKMGSMSRLIGMIPGMTKVTPAQIREAEKKLAFVESMINAMTAEEREKPELLAESRERRIRVVEESGKTEQEVSQLVAQLFQMRAQMQKLIGTSWHRTVEEEAQQDDAEGAGCSGWRPEFLSWTVGVHCTSELLLSSASKNQS